MKFMPYSPRNSEAVLCMLQHHVDYTPEFDSEENNQANIEFWQADRNKTVLAGCHGR